MGEEFECEVRIDDKDETFVTNVTFRLLPRIGEHFATKIDGNIHQFIIKDIWHWTHDSKTGHKIIIYVNHHVKIV